MPLPIPEPGLVIRYGFLWHEAHVSGRDEDQKTRPCAIILRTISADGEVIVTVLPITHSEPRDPDNAVELPFKVRQHLGLDTDRSWVVLSEVNRFVWPGPDLGTVPLAGSGRFDYGQLPPGLFRTIRERFLSCVKTQRLRVVWRNE